MQPKKLITDYFGVIKNVSKDRYGNLILQSNCGKSVKMASGKWSQDIPRIEKKCSDSIGTEVNIITSQTTAPWQPAEYFCDIESA